MNLSKFKAPIGCLFAGSLYALGFPTKLFETLLITPILGFALYFYYIYNAKNIAQSIALTLIFSLGFNLTGFYWIPHTLQEFGGMNYFMALLLGTCFSLIILPQHYLSSIVIKKWGRFLYQNFWGLCVLALLITIFEKFIPQQFPAHIGHSLYPFKRSLIFASIFGAGFYSFLSYLIALNLSTQKYKRTLYLTLAIIIIHILAIPFKQQDSEILNELNIRIVQANISSDEKVKAEKQIGNSTKSVLDMYSQLSTESGQLETIDLIVWPETAYPFPLKSDLVHSQAFFFPPIFKNIMGKMDAQMIIGGYDRISTTDPFDYFQTEFNTAFLLDSQELIKQTFHKIQLIPFGETLPFGPLNKKLSKVLNNVSFFAQGEEFTHFQLKSGTRLITPICYEILDSSFIRNFLNANKDQAHLIVNLTNDSWYGDTSEPYQHLFLAKWRALEFDIPILRSTNTGISSYIYSNGDESQRLKISQRDKLDLKVQIPNREATFYQKWGFLGTTLTMLFICLLAFVIERKFKLS